MATSTNVVWHCLVAGAVKVSLTVIMPALNQLAAAKLRDLTHVSTSNTSCDRFRISELIAVFMPNAQRGGSHTIV
jgi:hypothetical protein